MASLRLGVIADIHAGPSDAPVETWQGDYAPSEGAALARRAVDLLCEQGIDALVVLGDSANAGDHASLLEAIAAISRPDIPTWIVAGNVDLRLDQSALEDALSAAKSAATIPGAVGERFAGFRIAGLRFQGSNDDEIALHVRPDVASWGADSVVLVSHYPVISRRREALADGWKYSGDALRLDGLADELAARPAPTIVLHGHLHLRDSVARGSLLQLGFPALAEHGHQASIVAVDERDGDLDLEIRPISALGGGRPAAAVATPSLRWTCASYYWSAASPESG